MAELERVTAVFTAEFRQLQTAFDKIASQARRTALSVSAAFKKAGEELEKIGRKLAITLTAPLTALAGGATKFSADFETQMQSIVGLVGDSQEQVDAWAKELIRLGPQLGRTPIELARGLYSVRSSGVDAARSMDVLTASAKASAAGLGTVADVAKVVTAAVNTWEAEGLTAAEAVDILTQTINKGAIEVDELVGSLGQVLGTAQAAGASFNDVGAALAVMSLQGLPAAEAVTSLNSVLTAMLGSGPAAVEALKEMGTSTQELRAIVAGPGGLLEALTLIASRTDGNSEAIRLAIPNIRALRAVLSITGQDAAKVADIFEALRNSTGATDKAFAAIALTTEFKFRAATSALQGTLITVGDVLKASVNDVLDRTVRILQAATEWFANLSAESRKFLIWAGAIAAALGPALVAIGLISQGIGLAARALALFLVPFRAVIGFILRQIGLLAAAFATWPVAAGAAFAAVLGAAYLFRRTIVAFFTGLGKAIGFAFEQAFHNYLVVPFIEATNFIIRTINSIPQLFGASGLGELTVPKLIEGDPGDLFGDAISDAGEQARQDLANIKKDLAAFGDDALNVIKGVLPAGLVGLIFGGPDVSRLGALGPIGLTNLSFDALQDGLNRAKAEIDKLAGTGTGGPAKADILPPGPSRQEAVNAQLERAAQLTLDLRTAQEAYNDALLSFGQLREDGLITEETYRRALARSKAELDEQAETLLGDLRTAQEVYEQRLIALSRALADGTIEWHEFQRAAAAAQKTLYDATKQTDDLGFKVEDLGLTFTSAFEDAVIAGNDLRDVLRGLAEDLARLFLRKGITEPIFGAIGGLDLGSLIASAFGFGGATLPTGGVHGTPIPGRAHGGPVSAGVPYVVGEMGRRELFVPNVDGRIVPGGAAGGGPPRVEVNVYAPPGSTVRQERQKGPDLERLNVYVDQATARNLRPGTQTFRALRNQFGVAPQLIER